MNYKYKISTSVNLDEWNNLLKKSGYSSFFQTAQNIVSKPNDTLPFFIMVLDQNEEIKGQLALNIIKTSVMYSSKFLRTLNKMISKITSRIIWVYGPIIHSTNNDERNKILSEILCAVDEISMKYDVVHIEGQTPPYDFSIETNYLKIFEKNNYSKIDFQSFVTDLRNSKDEIWKNISKKTRGDVNRAKKRNLTTKILENEHELDEFIKLNQDWCKTKGLIITDTKKEKQLLWNNHKNGIETIFLAYKENKLISGLRIGCFNRIAYTNFVINSYFDSTNLGGTMLTWTAINWAKENNFKFYDFSGGPNLKNKNDHKNIQSLLFYKSKWGGEKFSYYVFIKIRKKLSYKLFMILFKLLRKYHDIRGS